MSVTPRIPQPTKARNFKETYSLADQQELIRNLMHRVGADNSEDFNALTYLSNIAVNTSRIGMFPDARVIHVDTIATATELLVRCLPGQFIVVLDMFLSLDGAADVTFHDDHGVNIMAPMYAPNNGQGFVKNSAWGIWLPFSTSLYYSCSAAVDHSVEINYKIIERR